jgi:predicted N-acyltransferase
MPAVTILAKQTLLHAMTIAAKARAIGASLLSIHEERKRLRGPANLRYAIADSIAMLDAGHWGALTSGASFFLSREYLRGLEPVLPANLSPRYAMIYREGKDGPQPLAAVYMQLADISLAQLRPAKPRADAAAAAPLDKLAAGAMQRVLTCGNLLTYGQHGIAMAPGADEKQVWHGVAEVLYRVRQAEKLVGKTHFVMIKDLHEPHTEGARHLQHLSYRYVETEPNMILSLGPSWKTHDDYLGGLTSKYRTNTRNNVFKPIEAAGCSVERLTDLSAHRQRIFDLYKDVQSNADVRPFELRPEYFAALQQVAGERFRCSVIKRHGQLLGFMVSVADGETSVAYHIGFDREAAAELPLYLRLLHAGIEHALEMGCRRISYGRTALEPKAALGAKPEAFGVLCRHRQPVLNKLIKRVLTGIEHEEAPERSPFKKAA